MNTGKTVALSDKERISKLIELKNIQVRSGILGRRAVKIVNELLDDSQRIAKKGTP